ncbi:hypothetical protein [Pseudoalteromonas sp. APC 3250]|jgi:hypothetical protein|uniref:hypothetical protein n=1 Tax=Pseudoalteromonas sp. APC 3250 TaxID=3035184 RepID=UPI000792104C|nr:hypothetical protein [Pseudoalteromonas sp. APC 3250]KXJ50354.1 MAG: hypothetical protein AXW15_12735 [Neptuniibacter sp. Phe_28]MDN3414527.1 hypothetical protein [Pseudoalteromonas sp. APC 3250]
MEKNGLFLRWLEIEKKRDSQIAGINRLNEACGTSYSKTWPGVMKTREYNMERIPLEVRRYMMRQVLPTLIDVQKKDIEKLIVSLT